MFSRTFERSDKFIAFTPYHFLAFTIFLICDGSLHFGLPLLLTNMVTPSFFRIFSNDKPTQTFSENFMKII